MNPNDLRHRITFQKLTSIINTNGFPEDVWADIATVWASKNNLSGREFWGAKVVQSENTVEFSIRYSSFIDDIDSRTYRIVHGKKMVEGLEVDRVYNITFVDHVDFKKVLVKIRSLEAVV